MMAELRWQPLLDAEAIPGAYRCADVLPLASMPQHWHHYSMPRLARLTRSAMLAALAKTLQFPDYFAGTWEGAYDCLTDQDWLTGSVVVIEFDLNGTTAIDGSALGTFVDLVRDAADYWDGHRVRLFCLFSNGKAQHPVVEHIGILPPLSGGN